jgi:NDP-sugar pyrophosphorylase family protein
MATDYRTLALVLAGGEGTNVRPYLREEDGESVKPMMKIGEYEGRLIDVVLKSLKDLDAELAVLSFNSEEYRGLDATANDNGARVLYQKARHVKLPHFLYFIDVPRVLIKQYHHSDDREYLRGFDSILTAPCDIVLENFDLGEMIDFHNGNLGNPEERQVTILSKGSDYGTDKERTNLFKIRNERVFGIRGYKGFPVEGYEEFTQPGFYMVSRGVLEHPWKTLFGGFRRSRILIHEMCGTWIDYGDPEVLEKIRPQSRP